MRTRLIVAGSAILLVVSTLAVIKVQAHKAVCQNVTRIIRSYPDSVRERMIAGKGPEKITPEMLRIATSLKNLNIDEKGPGGRTRLYHAAASGDKDMVRLLLAAGASTRVREDTYLDTPLHMAKTVAIAEMLLVNGSDINAVNSRGWTAVYMAASDGNKRLVAFLCERGASEYQAQRGAEDGCMANLAGVETAKEQWAMDHRAGWNSTPTKHNLQEYAYSSSMLSCPGDGTYEIGDMTTEPSCSVHGTHSGYGRYR